MSNNEIIEIAKQRGIEFDSFCLINFVREREHGHMSIGQLHPPKGGCLSKG